MPSKVERQIPTQRIPGPLQPFAVNITEQFAKTADDIDLVMGASGIETAGLAPTNVPTNTTKTIVANEDGSIDVVLTWDYTQGVVKAEYFVLFWKEGPAPLSALTFSDNNVGVGVTARAFRFEGLNPNNNYRFGIAAGRRPTADSGVIVGNIVQPTTGGGSWDNLTFGVPNYLGKVWGKEQHNFLVRATGFLAFNHPTYGVEKDGIAITWPLADARYDTGSSLVRGFNLLIYNLNTKAVEYAHAYSTLILSAVAYTTADRLIQDNSGTVAGDNINSVNAVGKFGGGLRLVYVGATRLMVRTNGASARYSACRTVECWYKGTGYGNLVTLSNVATADSGVRIQALRILSSGLPFASARNNAGATFSITGANVVNDDAWHHLCTQIGDGGGLRLYVDGVEQSGDGGSGFTSFDSLAPTEAKYACLFYGPVGNWTGSGAIDELAITPGQLQGQTFGFTPPVREYADDVVSTVDAENAGIWHFQENHGNNEWINALRPAKSLATLLANYNSRAQTDGLATSNFAFILTSRVNPVPGHTLDGLPDAIAAIGGTRALLLSSAFRNQSAYVLVGKVLSEEGNGFERYAGKTDGDTRAFAQVAFQTQDADMVALGGKGWEPVIIPGVPTNDPAGLALTNTVIATGNRVHKLTWTYTQPDLSGDSKLADGFVLFFQATDTANPVEHQVKLDITSRSTTFEWSFATGGVVSYAIATYRKTTSGVEVGAKQQIAAWKNVAAAQVIQTAGIDNNAITEQKLADGSVTAIKTGNLDASKITGGLFVVNPVSGGATGIEVNDGGVIKMETVVGSPSRIVFADGAGVEKMELTGGTGLLKLNSKTNNVNTLHLGETDGDPRWGRIEIAAENLYLNTDDLRFTGASLINAATGATKANWKILVKRLDGSTLGYLQLMTT